MRPTAPRPSVSRRRLLRGLSGFCVALPFLEYFAPTRRVLAQAVPVPKRYAFLFAGFSIGSNPTGKIAPAVEGPLAGNLTRGLKPLGDLGVTDVVSLVSGLKIPVGDTSPTAGRIASFHSTSHQVLSTGQRYVSGSLPAPSSDWIAAETLAPGTLQPVLVYRAQPSFYRVDSKGLTDGIISARKTAAGKLEQVAPVSSPRLAYESLFSGFVPPDPLEAERAKRLLLMRKSAVDLVSEDASALIGRLGNADKLRMQRHFDELRSLETRLNAIDLPNGPSCVRLPQPSDDPAIGDGIDPKAGTGSYNDHYKNANGYSDEELRATVMTDLIHMAFACDISRVASFMLTYAQCFMNMYTLLNYPSDLHEITHGAIGKNGDEMQDALADCAAWHVKHFARLVQKLRDTEDTDGSSLLDNTALTLAFEGGWGFDLETMGMNSPHSTENMVMLVGGRAGGLHKAPGRHLKALGTHPTAVLNTLLKAVGVDKTLGEVPDRVDALLA